MEAVITKQAATQILIAHGVLQGTSLLDQPVHPAVPALPATSLQQPVQAVTNASLGPHQTHQALQTLAQSVTLDSGRDRVQQFVLTVLTSCPTHLLPGQIAVMYHYQVFLYYLI